MYILFLNIDDLLNINNSTYDNHLEKLIKVLKRLSDVELHVDTKKSFFVMHEIEYLGYIITREGVKPQLEKFSAIRALRPPASVKELRKLLGMVQYYRDLWKRQSHLLTPLTDLVGECGHTKETRQNGIKKKAWYWNDTHQQSFD